MVTLHSRKASHTKLCSQTQTCLYLTKGPFWFVSGSFYSDRTYLSYWDRSDGCQGKNNNKTDIQVKKTKTDWSSKHRKDMLLQIIWVKTPLCIDSGGSYSKRTKFPHLREARKCFGPWSFFLCDGSHAAVISWVPLLALLEVVFY